MITTHNNTLARLALASAARTNGAANGVAIDVNQFNNNFRDIAFVITTGTITDGSVAVTVEESDQSGSGFAAVDSSRVLGTLPTIAAADDDTVLSFGVRPTKRYVRLVATTSGATTGGVFSAVAVLGNGGKSPVARS
ncbi:hypothetical protein [Mycobacteroides chelonae]|uniref:hypothetical protein n=1 Tax=Mycobacteroides chelonae TaxID=1774 RepID=UPI00099201A0|nr:hypothetical protein [Mycobacteroides chelonae]MEC4836875.1 hypothetical protein [Mycobacteroides chelonae]